MMDPRRIDIAGRLILALMAIGFAALLSYRVLQPTMTAKRDLDAYREAMEVLAPGQGEVDRLNAEVRLVTEAVRASEALLPRVANLDSFLGQMGTWAREAQVRVENLQPHEVQDHRLFRKLTVDVRVRGQFMSIYGFLNRLEGGQQLLRVEELHMVSSSGQQGLAADMRLALYFAPEEQS